MFVKIEKIQLDQYYRTPCCRTAVITQYPDGSADLAVYDIGVKVFEQRYDSRKGALIAMEKRYGQCKFSHMANVVNSTN